MNQFSNFPSTRAARTAASPRIAVISAVWHADIVARTREAFLAELARHGIASDDVRRHEVPGAFEIPLLAARLAHSKQVDAIAACALVVDGGIYRHEFVAAAVIDGLMRVQLDSGVPVFSAVLTPQQFHEHQAHARFFAEHMVQKGQELAHAVMATLAAHASLPDAA